MYSLRRSYPVSSMSPPLSLSPLSTSPIPLFIHQPHSPPPPKTPHLLLLHGFLSTHLDLIPLAQQLTSLNLPLILFDLPLHSPTSPKPVSLPDAARLVLLSLSSLPSPIHIIPIGYSLGGRIALHLSLLAPTNIQIDSVVMISAAPPPKTTQELTDRKNAAERLAARIGQEGDAWIENWYLADMWGDLRFRPGFDEMMERRRSMLKGEGRHRMIQAAKVYGNYEQSVPEGIHVSGLYIYGAKDEKYKQLEQKVESLFLRGGTAVGIDDAGHNVIAEKRNEVARLIDQWVQTVAIKQSVRIKNVFISKYRLGMLKQIEVGGKTVKERDGVLMAVQSEEDVVGIGDICPLPGLHIEDVKFCEKQVVEIARNLSSMVIEKERFQVGMLEEVIRDAAPVVKNGITCAIMHVLVQVWGIGLKDLLNVGRRIRCNTTARSTITDTMKSGTKVYLNGVLPRMSMDPNDGDSAESRGRILRDFIKNSPFKTLKIKVGMLSSPEQEGHLVRQAAEECRILNKAIRLDANRAWTQEQFLAFNKITRDVHDVIQFIEEPMQSIENLQTWLKIADDSCGLKVGLDETIARYEDHWQDTIGEIRDMARSAACRALVVKPAVLGSFSFITELADIANEVDCSLVFSTVFDSGVGIAWAAIMASVLGNGDSAHGLGTYKFLSNDVLGKNFRERCVDESGSYIDTRSCWDFLRSVANFVQCEGHAVICTDDSPK